MAEAPYRVLPAWPDVMVYSEGEERTLRLNCRSADEPPVVELPAEARWREQTPAWAHERRALIVERLQRANCVLSEVDGRFTRTSSLDGSLLLEFELVQDERTGMWEAARVVDVRDNHVLASVQSYGSSCAVRFPAARSLILTFQDRQRGQRKLTIDADRKSYSLDSSPPSRPLAELASVLADEPARPYSPPQRDTQHGSSWLLLFGGIVLTCVGAWQVASSASLKDRVLGALCVAFFGTTTWLSVRRSGGN